MVFLIEEANRHRIKMHIYLCIFSVIFMVSGYSFAEDLSESKNDKIIPVDFSQNGIISLEGPWALYVHQWIKPSSQFPSKEVIGVPDAWVSLPFFWNELQTHQLTPDSSLHQKISRYRQLNLSPLGYASYRLTFHYKPVKGEKNLTLKIPKHYSAMKVFINGYLVGQLGQPGRLARQEVPGAGIVHKDIPNSLWHSEGKQEIVIHMSNYVKESAGIQTIPQIGYSELMYEQASYRIVRDMLLNGCIIAMGLYHLLIFCFLRKKNTSALYLGITCLIGAMFNIIVQRDIVGMVFSEIDGRAIWYIYLSLWYLAAIFIMSFLKNITSPYFSEFMYRFFIFLFLMLIITLMILPLHTHMTLLNVPRFLSVFAFIYALYAGVRAWLNGRTGSSIFLVTSIIYFFMFSHDVLMAILGIPALYLSTYGLIVFILGIAFVISKQYSENMKKIEAYSKKVTLLNNSLEAQVQERTALLEDALKEASDMNDKLRTYSEKDGLTGAFNRRFFDQQLQMQWQQSQKQQSELTLILIDIDHFKRFNDNHGHLCGDACLVHIAELIQQSLRRNSDFVARYGGEEFAILMMSPMGLAVKIAETLRKAIEETKFKYDGSDLSITASFGISCFAFDYIQETELEPAQLIQEADRRLYTAKREGRNRVCWQDSLKNQNTA